MSCGLPVVATRAGLFEDTVFNPRVGEIVDWNCKPETFAEAIERAFQNYNQYQPRQWIVENATYEKFAENWKNFLASI